IVSPPATAAIASAIRESSPPEAVSATGANGRPAFGRTRKATWSAPVGPGSAAVSSARNSPSPTPSPASSSPTASAKPAPAPAPGAPVRDRVGEARRGLGPGEAQRRVQAVDLVLDGREGLGSGFDRVVAVGDGVELLARRRGSLEQLRVGAGAVPASKVGEP